MLHIDISILQFSHNCFMDFNNIGKLLEKVTYIFLAQNKKEKKIKKTSVNKLSSPLLEILHI